MYRAIKIDFGHSYCTEDQQACWMRVEAKHPRVFVDDLTDGKIRIWSSDLAGGFILGTGKTEGEAWESADKGLEFLTLFEDGG